ncbi:hypothetical protein A0H81_08962 [Grifola frondosa]|uniref:Uncharacterized protein n=1 Tax=Grifola frondosa TaxID=5627 RepID=A0A1C7M5T6_GRIFR|nr:hypothetical protein A0H81_08962 [Grifola frondosa]
MFLPTCVDRLRCVQFNSTKLVFELTGPSSAGHSGGATQGASAHTDAEENESVVEPQHKRRRLDEDDEDSNDLEYIDSDIVSANLQFHNPSPASSSEPSAPGAAANHGAALNHRENHGAAANHGENHGAAANHGENYGAAVNHGENANLGDNANSGEDWIDPGSLAAPAPNEPDVPLVEPELVPKIEDIKTAIEFIKLLRTATLQESGLEPEDLERLCNPPQEPLEIDDPDLLLSLELFLAVSNASRETYNSVRDAIIRRYPTSNIRTYYQVKTKVAELSGVIPLVNDMCTNSCVAFTGAFAALESCPVCDASRYDPIKLTASNGRIKVARQHYYTMPVGSQIQVQFRTAQGASDMAYFHKSMEEVVAQIEANGGLINSFEDITHGSDFYDAYKDGRIGPKDILLMLSIDGAQLYRNKQSDCWIYIWVILNLSPDRRYQKRFVLPGGIIPGPNHPKNLDSFLFPGLHHLSALQLHGLRIWNALENSLYTSKLFLAMVTADGIAMAAMNGLVGHHGAHGCRLQCPLKGRHKPNCPHYYPALLLPHNYTVQGCSHPDVDLSQLPPPSVHEYRRNLGLRREFA